MLMLIEKLKAAGVEDADLLQFKAGAYILTGETEKAVSLLQRVLKMSPTIEVHQTLANFYEQQKDPAKRDYHQAKTALFYAMISFRNNHLPSAAESIQNSIELNPNDPQAWFYYAEIKRLMGDLKAAQEGYEKCLKLNPNHGRAITELARIKSSAS